MRFWPKMIRGMERSMRVLRRASSPFMSRGTLARVDWLTAPPGKLVSESHADWNTPERMQELVRRDALSRCPHCDLQGGHQELAILATPRG